MDIDKPQFLVLLLHQLEKFGTRDFRADKRQITRLGGLSMYHTRGNIGQSRLARRYLEEGLGHSETTFDVDLKVSPRFGKTGILGRDDTGQVARIVDQNITSTDAFEGTIDDFLVGNIRVEGGDLNVFELVLDSCLGCQECFFLCDHLWRCVWPLLWRIL